MRDQAGKIVDYNIRFQDGAIVLEFVPYIDKTKYYYIGMSDDDVVRLISDLSKALARR